MLLTSDIESLLVYLHGSNYQQKIGAIDYIQEHRIVDNRVVDTLKLLVIQDEDRYVRDLAQRTLNSLAQSASETTVSNQGQTSQDVHLSDSSNVEVPLINLPVREFFEGTFPLVPHKSFLINTSLDVDGAVKIISQKNFPPSGQIFPWFERRKGFEGEVSKRGFSVKRVINYRNVFLPTLRGKFIPIGQVVQVAVQIVVSPLAWIFIMILLVGMPLAGIFLMGNNPLEEIYSDIPAWLFMYLIGLVLFWFEAYKAEQLMRSLYEPYR